MAYSGVLDFPLLATHEENGKRIVYLDNAATTQKPQMVISAVDNYYKRYVANPHRGAYALSAEATEIYEQARARAARFIGAKGAENIVFTKNTTEAINLVAKGYLLDRLESGDEILISICAHHSNLIPWQDIARRKNAVLKYMYIDEKGRVPVEEAKKKINSRTKFVAISHVSNVLGIENPVREIADIAHKNGALILVDGAQSVPHMPVNVKDLDVDFLAFSGHKMLAPAGIGVLYGRYDLLQETQPMCLGGGIVEEVTEQTVLLMDAPGKFEAGTPNVEAAVGLNAAMDYIEAIGFDYIQETERKLTRYMLEKLAEIPEIKIFGDDTGERTGIVSFNFGDVHPHDVASILDNDGVTIRAGHHCAQPLLTYLNVKSCCRASLYFTNTIEDIDIFAKSLEGVRRWLG